MSILNNDVNLMTADDDEEEFENAQIQYFHYHDYIKQNRFFNVGSDVNKLLFLLKTCPVADALYVAGSYMYKTQLQGDELYIMMCSSINSLFASESLLIQSPDNFMVFGASAYMQPLSDFIESLEDSLSD